MKSLSELSAFIDSESFSLLDDETQKSILEKLRDNVNDVCNQMGVETIKETDLYKISNFYALGLKIR